MVWNLEDFIREIRRQLVELEALRRKIRGEHGAHENIERLEKSQRHLLRKLSEYFKGSLTSHHCHTSSAAELEEIPDGILEHIQTVLQHPEILKHLGEKEPCSGHEKVHAWLVVAVQDGDSSPYIEAKCAICGKLLVSSILAGDPVIREGEDWFHKRCHEPGDEFWRPFLLN